MSFRTSRRRSWILPLVLSLVLVAAACGSDDDGEGGATTTTGGAAQGQPVTGGVFTDFQNFASGEPEHIDAGLVSDIQGSQPGQLIWDGLTENDYKTGELKPMVAESFSGNDDATVWTFKIRKDVKFHNGNPVLPSSFKFAWERVVQKEFASDLAYHFDVIKGKADVDDGKTKELAGVKADDANMTLTVETTEPYSTFPASVSHLVFSPMDQKSMAGLADQTQYEQGIMIGNGPYKMKEPWKHDDSITLVRFDDYWGGLNKHKGYVDEIVFKISKDVDSAYADFEAGNGQTGYIPPARFTEAIGKYPNATKPSLGAYYFVFNMKDPVVGGAENKKLREAIALAIDRKAIIDTVYNGSRTLATGLTPPGIPGYKAGLDKEAGRDLAKAKQLMTEYGRKPPAIKLNFNAGSGHEPVATIVQANLKEIGIDSTLDPRDRTTYFTTIKQGTGQFSRAGWISDYVAYDNWLYPLVHTKSIGGDNLAQYSNPQVDKLINDARAETDDAARNKLYQDAEQIVLDDQAIVPFNWYTGQIVYTNKVKNFIQSPLQFVAYEELWLEK